MSSLPIAGAPAESRSTPLSGAVQVFDPAMCCPTGLCGPGVDPALLVLARDLRWLQAAGVTVERFGLAQQPEAFTKNSAVSELIETVGDSALPATLVNGKLLLHGAYPTRELLVSALGGSPRSADPAAAPCCEPGSGCC
ncbi:MAG: arsenite efflux transporter metallochaperone ArsD [Gemmatimonadota bacterium]|nr:arsenite efflux transporter metallochaperone ArsD [Gemmatimonadota bacterium]